MDTKIEDIQQQLQTVEQALLAVADDSERISLSNLRADLLELLDLTKQTLALAERTTVCSKEDIMGNEMLLFMNEIQDLNNSSERFTDQRLTEAIEIDVHDELMELQKQLKSMIGQKCSAPHQHTWGSVVHHNAIICGVDDTAMNKKYTLDICLRIFFTNPTHREMIPCTYYLDGECKFDAAGCHYSHGELVPFGDLREYTEPEFNKLSRNCVVLAKMQDRMWHRGRVLCVNFMEKLCRVRLDESYHKDKELDLSFENLFPIFHDGDLSSGSSSDVDNDSDSEKWDDLETRDHLTKRNLFTFSPNQPLGEWEKHTRGIGSKLMAKMGYVHGTSLGWDGRGIITPVTAQILPQRCSLDYCMELREAANGDKNLFSVEKKLQSDKKKQNKLNLKKYESEVQRVDVFSFLNDSILNKKKKQKTLTKPSTSLLQNQTTQSLNVESVRIADDIRKKERHLARIKKSMHRNAISTSVHKHLQAQLTNMTHELDALKNAENTVMKEQTTRKTKDKLCVF